MRPLTVVVVVIRQLVFVDPADPEYSSKVRQFGEEEAEHREAARRGMRHALACPDDMQVAVNAQRPG